MSLGEGSVVNILYSRCLDIFSLSLLFLILVRIINSCVVRFSELAIYKLSQIFLINKIGEAFPFSFQKVMTSQNHSFVEIPSLREKF